MGAPRSRVVVLPGLALAGALALAAAVPATAASAATAKGTVYVLQGMPGITADVVLDGATVARGIPSATVVGPLRVTAGSHTVAVSSAGTQLVSGGVTVGSGASLDVLGYWAAETPTMPRITVLPNDLSPVAAGKARVVVTHGIAGPPADIRVNGKVLFRSVANGESLTVLVPAGTYQVAAVATLSGQTLLPEARLPVRAGTLTRAVAIGAPGMTPAVLVHVLSVPGRVSGDRIPTGVGTGNGGQAAGLFGWSPAGPKDLLRLTFELLSLSFIVLALLVVVSARRAASASRNAR